MATSERDESEIVTDITIYGATSFVARHVLNYLVELSPSLPRELKISLAGRDQGKLDKVQGTVTPPPLNLAFDVVVANSTDVGALHKMTARTRCVINCAGPFELYSSGVVKACADTGCDYVDITGEVQWVGDMRVKYGAAAAKSGARIISLCGFDSIPSDLAIFAAVQELKAARGSDAEIESARTWHSCLGMAGGGTLATIKAASVDIVKCLFDNNRQLRKVPLLMYDPLVLTHPESIRFNPDHEEDRCRLASTEWLNMLPYPHTILQQGFSIPFFMAPLNAKVVHASALALNYGPKFTYQERFLPLGFEITSKLGFLSIIPAILVRFFLSMAGLVIKLPVIGDLLLQRFAPPGTGASDDFCKRGYAHVYAEVKAPLPDSPPDTTGSSSGDRNVSCANAWMKFTGDPGNWVTAQCVVESALCLVLDRKELPARSKDGFGTPAELLGPVLLKRLKETTVRPVIIQTNVRIKERDHEYKLYL